MFFDVLFFFFHMDADRDDRRDRKTFSRTTTGTGRVWILSFHKLDQVCNAFSRMSVRLIIVF